MKQITLVLVIICAIFTSCKTINVGGEITYLAQTDSTLSIGFKAHAKGKLQPKLDSLYLGYPITLGDHIIQVTHTDSTFDSRGLLNFKTK